MGVILPVVLVVLATTLLHFIRKHLNLRDSLKKIPQPRSYPIVGHALVTKPDPEGFANQVMGMGYLFPDAPRMCLLWLGPLPALMVYSAETVEAVLTSSKHLDKGFAYNLLEPWLGLSILTSQTSQWRPKRKLLTPTFHYDILKDFLPVFNEQAKILVNKIQAAQGTPIEVLSYITLCALDIICETSMGKSVHAQLSADNEYVWAVHTINDIIQNRTKNPLLWNDAIFNLTSAGRTHKKCLEILHGFTRKVIEERSVELEERNWKLEGRRAFLDLLLDMAHSGQIDPADIQAEVDTFMFEGHDTTSTGLLWALHLIGNHPEILAKVHKELDEVVGNADEITTDHLSQLKYLECCIKEALRLFPSVPVVMRELGDDQMIGGHLVPKGVHIAINLYMVHRDPAQWPNPDVYDPSRFLLENTTKRHSFSFIPFSAGSRNCIGQRFALLEEKVILAHLLKNFSIKAVEQRHEIFGKMEIIMRPANPVHIIFTKRQR